MLTFYQVKSKLHVQKVLDDWEGFPKRQANSFFQTPHFQLLKTKLKKRQSIKWFFPKETWLPLIRIFPKQGRGRTPLWETHDLILLYKGFLIWLVLEQKRPRFFLSFWAGRATQSQSGGLLIVFLKKKKKHAERQPSPCMVFLSLVEHLSQYAGGKRGRESPYISSRQIHRELSLLLCDGLCTYDLTLQFEEIRISLDNPYCSQLKYFFKRSPKSSVPRRIFCFFSNPTIPRLTTHVCVSNDKLESNRRSHDYW